MKEAIECQRVCQIRPIKMEGFISLCYASVDLFSK